MADVSWLQMLQFHSAQCCRDLRFSILSALESLSYGALWLFPFYTEVRFALVAPASAANSSQDSGWGCLGMAGKYMELAQV